ncbi:MAG: hypothetical protein E7231_06605 [Cellulosilyticum sp.]|nr:hypothetical protein [Cellulosilyticum sp.]
MKWYCNKCRRCHSNDEICPYIRKQIEKHPEWIGEAADLVNIMGQYTLITSNELDKVAKSVNKIIGTNLSYEGTHQFVRDIQVFKRLDEEAFKQMKVFSTPENAKDYLKILQARADEMERMGILDGRKNSIQIFDKKLTGYAQEVDWLRRKNGQIKSLIQKNSLLDGNAAGIDGMTINRFNGKIIHRTTIKSSIGVMTKDSTAIKDIKEAILKETATQEDIIFSVKGTSGAAKEAGLTNKVIEKNTGSQVRDSNERLRAKILKGEATTSVTSQNIIKEVTQGAIVGAAVGLTVSTITSYIRYKNGELGEKEAFLKISEDTMNSTVIGAAIGGISIFLPPGEMGILGGMMIGIYISATCKNILDEIYGKGVYETILNSSGYIYGMTYNMKEDLERISKSQNCAYKNIKKVQYISSSVEQEFELFDKMGWDR